MCRITFGEGETSSNSAIIHRYSISARAAPSWTLRPAPEGDFPSKRWGHSACSWEEWPAPGRSALLLFGVAIPVYNQNRSRFNGLFEWSRMKIFATPSIAMYGSGRSRGNRQNTCSSIIRFRRSPPDDHQRGHRDFWPKSNKTKIDIRYF